MRDNKRSCGRSNNWSSQDGINQNWIISRTRSNYRLKIKRSSPTALSPSIIPSNTVALSDNVANGPNGLDGLAVAGIVIGSLTILVMIIMIIYYLIRKRKEFSESQNQKDEELQSPPPLTITFVKHNHPIPELCTTPDTQPILDYYSSKAGLTDVSSPPIININSNNKLNRSNNEDNNDNKSEINGNNRKSLENKEYVPQYYNGMEIPPLGARIIPLERQVQIAKELTSVNSNPTNHKRKSNRSISSMLSISSILSINSKRKSFTSNTISNHHNNNNNNNNNNNINNNSSTTISNSLAQISETENTAKIVS